MVVDIPILNSKPVKVGNSHYFFIPYQYVKNMLVDPKELYDVRVDRKASVPLVLEKRKVSYNVGSYMVLIDYKFIEDKKISPSKKYSIFLNKV